MSEYIAGIAIFTLVLSPLAIPIIITVIHGCCGLASNPIRRPSGHRTADDNPGAMTPMKQKLLSQLPRNLLHLADADGAVTFGGFSWLFVVGAARPFARTHNDVDVPPPFGFKRSGLWHWWDGSTSSDSIVEEPGAAEHVRRYLQRLYPCTTIERAVRPPLLRTT